VLNGPSGVISRYCCTLKFEWLHTLIRCFAVFKAVVMNFPSLWPERGRFDRRTDDEYQKANEKALKEAQ